MNQQNNKKRHAFTLVELIVVITILAILATLSFVSFQGYIKSARDANRVTTLKSIADGVNLFKIKNAKNPSPDQSINISLSGSNLAKQGNIGDELSHVIGLNTTPKDPLDKSPYLYATDKNNKGFKLVGFLEENDSAGIITQTYASNRKVTTFGNGPGFLLNLDDTPIAHGNIDLFVSEAETNYKLVVDSEHVIVGKGYQIGGTFQTLSLYGYRGFGQPDNCREGFIAIPGNPSFGQPGFCVAKYEMSYDIFLPNGSNGQFNTYKYDPNDQPTSMPDRFPITEISQEQAIASCEKIGTHLITNNEWMTIARNIEDGDDNWSGGKTGSGGIYSGIGNSDSSVLFCKTSSSNGRRPMQGTHLADGHEPFIVGTLGVDTPLWGGNKNNCDSKRQLKISNGNIIWDFAGNALEHVNKANTLNGIGYNDRKTSFPSACGSEFNTCKLDFYGPKNTSLKSSNGIGKLDLDAVENNVFMRGGGVYDVTGKGIYAINLEEDDTTVSARDTGFRCAY